MTKNPNNNLKNRNRAVLLALVVAIILIYAVTMLRIGGAH